MKNIAVRYGIIIFIVTVIWTLIEHVMGYNTTNHEIGQMTRMTTAFAYYAVVALAIWKVRRAQNNMLLFRQGMLTGLYCSLTYSVLVTLWFALYAEVINTQFQPTLLAFTKAKLEASGKSPAEVVKALKMEEMSSGGSVASYLLLFGFMLLFGLIVSLIASLVMRRQPKEIRIA